MSQTTATREPSADDKPIETSGKPNALPAGKVIKTDPNSWYYLKGTYVDDNGKAQTGYAYPVGQNAATSFWDYVVYQPGLYQGALQFSPQPAEGGWYFWKIKDDASNSGYHLDCKATGFLYRTNLYNTWWQIVDGKLYCSYWTAGVPVGSTYYSFLVSAGQYLAMGLPVSTVELVQV